MKREIRQFRLRSLYVCWDGSSGYFRLGAGEGWGIWLAIRSKRGARPFSERYGYARVWRVGPFDVKVLTA